MKKRIRRPAANHGQTALEYLITYGWAIAMILILLAVAFYDAFDPYKYIPGTCTLDRELGCLDYKITNNYVELSVANRLGEDITVSRIAIPGCNGTASGTLRKAEQKVFIITNCTFDSTSRYREQFSIDYTGKSGIVHREQGTLDGNVDASTAVPRTLAFQENGASVNETNDAQISFDSPNTNYGASSALTIDEQGPRAHAVIQFPNVVGNSEGQIPPETQIDSAILRVNCFNGGNLGKAYMLLEGWSESQVAWNNRTSSSAWSNAGADGPVSRDSNAVNWMCSWPAGYKNFDVTSFIQNWSNGAANYGVVVINTGTDGFDFYTSEHTTPTNRPMLIVNYTKYQ